MSLAPGDVLDWSAVGAETRSLEAVVDDLAPRLLRFTLGLLGSRPAAEEVSQVALLALVERWRRHGPPDVPEAFAFAVARRRAARERWRRRLLAPLEDDTERHEAAVDAVATGRLEAARALGELRHLRAGDREALLLVAVGGLSMEAAARALGLGLSAFKMRLSRARRRLRERLEGCHARD